MKRAVAFFTVQTTLRETLPALRTLARIGLRSDYHANLTTRLRDALLNFCHVFDPRESDAYFEEEYEAFVDAAAMLTLALKRQRLSHMQFVFLRAAVESLERIERSTGVST